MTFLLIALASFSLFARIADYSVTAREMKKVENSYHGVIIIDNGIPIINETKQQFSNLPKSTSYIPSTRAIPEPFVSPAVPKSLTTEEINSFSKLSYVETENRYMTGGVIEEMERLNPFISSEYNWGYDYGARFIIEGTFEEFADETFIIPGGGFVLNFSNIKQLAGRLQYDDGETVQLLAGTTIASNPDTIDYGTYYFPSRVFLGDESMNSSSPTSMPYSLFLFPNDPYRTEFVEGLIQGKRYVFIGRYMPNTFDRAGFESDVKEMLRSLDSKATAGLPQEVINALVRGEFTIEPIEDTIASYAKKRGESIAAGLTELISGNPLMRLGDYDTYDYVPSFIEISDTENIAKLQDIINITNQDLHTFDIVYTENMASIPRFNERSMVITSGRAITENDSETCVVSEYLANEYGLKLGDKLNIGLGDKLFEQYAQMGAIAYIPERNWSVVKETELEIIGIYKDIDAMESRNADMFMGYSPNTIFVPLSQLLIEIPADHEIKPGEFSVFIENPADFERVLAVAEPIATDMGVNLSASDGGYANIKDSINESAKTSVITMCLYIFAAALALVLSIYLYIGRNTKSYAIMRALGTTIEKSRNSLTLPFGFLTAIAILLGGIVGLVYTQNEMKTVLKSFEVLGSSYSADASIPVATVFMALICEVVFISGFTAIFLHRLAITSPLTLLQGDSSNRVKPKMNKNKAKNSVTQSNATSLPFEIREFVFSPLPEKRNFSPIRQTFTYISKHMMRTKWKTIIALILSCSLIITIGVIILTKSNYENMFKQVEVKSSVNNFNQASVLKLADIDLVKQLYFFVNKQTVINSIDNAVDLKITNDINRYFNDTFKSEPHITFSDGYSESIYSVDISSIANNAVCVIGSRVADDYDVNLGDNIDLMMFDAFQSCTTLINDPNYANMMSSAYEGRYETPEELQELVNIDIETAMVDWTKSFKVVGIVDSENDDIANIVYIPWGKTTELLISCNEPEEVFLRSPVAFSEIVLSDNEKVSEINALLDEMIDDSMEHYISEFSGSSSYYTDVSELENVRRVRDLLTSLFPIAVTAALLIGAVVPILIIIQSSKEAAIMRVLGTTKKRTIVILALEQIILCILGIVIATGVLLIYNAGLFILSGSTLAVCALIYLVASIMAAIIAAAATTNKKALELLQVKE
jgi:ABC-type antimicrobial peptide transport system permease subunit